MAKQITEIPQPTDLSNEDVVLERANITREIQDLQTRKNSFSDLDTIFETKTKANEELEKKNTELKNENAQLRLENKQLINDQLVEASKIRVIQNKAAAEQKLLDAILVNKSNAQKEFDDAKDGTKKEQEKLSKLEKEIADFPERKQKAVINMQKCIDDEKKAHDAMQKAKEAQTVLLNNHSSELEAAKKLTDDQRLEASAEKEKVLDYKLKQKAAQEAVSKAKQDANQIILTANKFRSEQEAIIAAKSLILDDRDGEISKRESWNKEKTTLLKIAKYELEKFYGRIISHVNFPDDEVKITEEKIK